MLPRPRSARDPSRQPWVAGLPVLHPHRGEERWHDVRVAADRVHPGTAPRLSQERGWQPEEEGDPDVLLVDWVVLLAQAVLPCQLPVVGGEDHDHVLGEPVRLQRLEHRAEVPVAVPEAVEVEVNQGRVVLRRHVAEDVVLDPAVVRGRRRKHELRVLRIRPTPGGRGPTVYRARVGDVVGVVGPGHETEAALVDRVGRRPGEGVHGEVVPDTLFERLHLLLLLPLGGPRTLR